MDFTELNPCKVAPDKALADFRRQHNDSPECLAENFISQHVLDTGGPMLQPTWMGRAVLRACRAAITPEQVVMWLMPDRSVVHYDTVHGIYDFTDAVGMELVTVL